MSRPTIPPDWATSANFPAGSDPWSATPTRVTPSSGKRAAGWTPKTKMAAQEGNSVLGNHGDWINYLDDLIDGPGFSFSDDFTGTVIDTGKWAINSASGPGAITAAANTGANGTAKITVTGSNGDGALQIFTSSIGLRDFRFVVRLKVELLGGASSAVTPQIGTGNDVFYFQAISGTTNWLAAVSVGGTPTTHDSGVAVSSSTYQALEIRRTGTLVEWLIDGDVVWQQTISLDIGGAGSALTLAANRATSGTTTVWFDCAKLRHDR